MLDLTGVVCERGGRRLFQPLTLQVSPGQLLRVEGANGAGKTSLLRLMCGLMSPAEGDVRWRGQKISASRDDFGHELLYLGHAAALKDDLSPLENLLASCALTGRTCKPLDGARALASAGLRGLENTLVRRLSQGQRKRSALARLALSLASPNPAPLWVLDEPFNALDTKACSWLIDLIKAHISCGGAVVLTSHQDLDLLDTPHQVLSL